MVYVLLGDGFEEMEALAPLDLLRRAGIKTLSVSLYDRREVVGGHGITFTADTTLSALPGTLPDMLVLPGGTGGVEELGKSKAVLDLIKRVFYADRFVAAICAAPTLLAKHGLLTDKNATCYPALLDLLGDAAVSADVCVDGKLITSRAAGTATDFALALIDALAGKEKMREVADSIYHHVG